MDLYELQTPRHPENKDLHPLASRRGGGGGDHRPQRCGEAAGVSGPVRTGAGRVAHGDGTGGAGEPEEGKDEVSGMSYEVLGIRKSGGAATGRLRPISVMLAFR